MVLAFNVNYTIRDQKGKESSSSIRIPSTLSIAQYAEFGTAAMQVVANISTGQIVNAGLSVSLDLAPGSLSTIVSTFADVAEKALFVVQGAIAGLFARFEIPTLDETNVVIAGTDQIDLAHADIAPWVAAIEDGITLTDTSVMQPTDKYGNDLTAIQTDREIFQSKRRQFVIPVPDSDNNASLPPDVTTDAFFNYQWRKIVVPVIVDELFAIADTIETQPEQMDFESRIYQLIIDIYNESPPVATYHEAERTTTQAIAANTQTPIVWSTGGSPPLFSFVTAPATGIATVTGRVKLLSGAAAVKYCAIIHNGVEVARGDIRSTANQQWFNVSHVLEVEAGDTFRLDVYCLLASTVQIDDFTPKLSMVIV